MGYIPEDLQKLEELPAPYEIYEFVPGVPAYFEVTDYKIGRIAIHPRWPGAPEEKTIVAIRLYVTPKCKPTSPPYYDITPARLVYALAPILASGKWRGYWLRIVRDIPGPKAHFQVSIVTGPEE